MKIKEQDGVLILTKDDTVRAWYDHEHKSYTVFGSFTLDELGEIINHIKEYCKTVENG